MQHVHVQHLASSTALQMQQKHLLEGVDSSLSRSTARRGALIVQAAAKGAALQVLHHAGGYLHTRVLQLKG